MNQETADASIHGSLLTFNSGSCDAVALNDSTLTSSAASEEKSEEPKTLAGVRGVVRMKVEPAANKKGGGEQSLQLKIVQTLGIERVKFAEYAVSEETRILKELEQSLQNSKAEMERVLEQVSEDEESVSRIGAMMVEQRTIEKKIKDKRAMERIQYEEYSTTRTYLLSPGVWSQIDECPMVWIPASTPSTSVVRKTGTTVPVTLQGSEFQIAEMPYDDVPGGGGGVKALFEGHPGSLFAEAGAKGCAMVVSGIQALFGTYAAPNRACRLQLLYQGSRDGYQPQVFHQKCDNQGATLTIAQSTTGYVFGGYADQPWSHNASFVASNAAWLFTFGNDKTAHSQLRKLTMNASYTYALYNQPSSGPVFGGGNDLCFRQQSVSCQPHTYTVDQNDFPGYTGSVTCATLAGNNSVQLSHIEVYKVVRLA